MCGVIELLFLKPAQIAHRPALLAGIGTAVLHEGAHLLPVDPQCFNRCRGRGRERDLASPRGLHREPIPPSVRGAQPQGQRNGVPAVRFHPIARLPWDQRWCHHRAFVAERPDQTIKTIAGRAGLVTEVDTVKPAGDPHYNAAHVEGRSIDFTEEANLSLPGLPPQSRWAFLSLATSIPTNASLFRHGSSCNEDRLGPPEQPSDA